jgi:hypothetical protein
MWKTKLEKPRNYVARLLFIRTQAQGLGEEETVLRVRSRDTSCKFLPTKLLGESHTMASMLARAVRRRVYLRLRGIHRTCYSHILQHLGLRREDIGVPSGAPRFLFRHKRRKGRTLLAGCPYTPLSLALNHWAQPSLGSDYTKY